MSFSGPKPIKFFNTGTNSISDYFNNIETPRYYDPPPKSSTPNIGSVAESYAHIYRNNPDFAPRLSPPPPPPYFPSPTITPMSDLESDLRNLGIEPVEKAKDFGHGAVYKNVGPTHFTSDSINGHHFTTDIGGKGYAEPSDKLKHRIFVDNEGNVLAGSNFELNMGNGTRKRTNRSI